MDNASEAILALKPVTFHYKSDDQGIPQFGLIAEEVAKVNPDLVVRDENGEIYTVRYDAVNAMLLNEFLKEHKKVEELNSNAVREDSTITDLKSTVTKQEAMIGRQQKAMEAFTVQLKEQAAQIQKVSAQVEMKKPAPRVASNSNEPRITRMARIKEEDAHERDERHGLKLPSLPFSRRSMPAAPKLLAKVGLLAGEKKWN